MVPASGYSTLQGYSHLPPEVDIPSTSRNRSATPAPTGSVGFSGFSLRDSGFEPDTLTTQHLDAHAPHLGDRDASQKIIIETEGSSYKPNEGISNIVVRCIGKHCRGFYPTWSSIPAYDQEQMFNEFKEYCEWAPEHDEKIEINFRSRAAKRLTDLFWNSRKHGKIPDFVQPDVWTRLLSYWATDKKFKKRSEIWKKARESVCEGRLSAH